MKFNHPWMLWLLFLWVPVIWLWLRHRAKGVPSITISSVKAFQKLPFGWKKFFDIGTLVLRLVAIGALVVALARPQRVDAVADNTINGTDIVIALDVSESMRTPDMAPNRFEAARDIASDFTQSRENDNVALVAFAGESLTMMPLTNDAASVIGAITNLQLGMLGDGTAIGDGLTTAINRVINGKAESKSIILITDGSDNASEVDPLTAAQIAKEKGVKVFTIAIGQDQMGSMGGFFDPMASLAAPIDTEILNQIADITGGKFYRATDNNTLKNIFEDIDHLQKTEMETSSFMHTEEYFMPWLILALVALALEMLIRLTVLRRLP